MKKESCTRAVSWSLPLTLILFVILTCLGQYIAGGVLLIAFWLALALRTRLGEFSKNFTFPVLVFACLTASMYFPSPFLKVGSLSSMALITPILQVIMFGMGTQLTLNDFYGVVRQPKGVLIGSSLQFLVMPISGFTLGKLFGFPDEIAAGLVLIGSVPGGIASNVMNFIARANVALSITLTAISTLLAPFATPVLMKFYAGQMVEVNMFAMMTSIMDIVIFPVVAGFLFQAAKESKLFSRRIAGMVFIPLVAVLAIYAILALVGGPEQLAVTRRLIWIVPLFFFAPLLLAKLLSAWLKHHEKQFESMIGVVSMLGLLIIITVINASGRDSMLEIGILLMVACMCHILIGYIIGYNVARLLGMDRQSCRTISIEVGLQNGGLASGLAVAMGKAATVGLAPGVFGPLMNISGSCLAGWWRNRRGDDDKPESENNVTESDDSNERSQAI
ncbi:MAG: bile acid:sodium symporter family protein [Planctomycetia bacterium]|nr:bile acid:sodium symporter family protein [Planctomycetia bacterium]